MKGLGDRDHTIVDGTGISAPVVSFIRNETGQSVLSGLTITGGSGSTTLGPLHPQGGGIYVLDSEPIIENCVIRDNTVGYRGFAAGIYIGGSSSVATTRPQVKSCEVFANSAGGNGGGIGIVGNVSVTILDCNVHDNIVIDGDGAGIYLASSSYGLVQHCMIHHNSAFDHGGGIYMTAPSQPSGASVDVIRNTIWSNVARAIPGTGDAGGGIWCYRIGGQILRNTIVANTGNGGDGAWGGGISTWDCPSLAIQNNIIAFQIAGGGLTCKGSAPLEVSHNLFWANVVNVSGNCGSIDLESSNSVADPQFCDGMLNSFAVADSSPALTLPNGVRGAVSEAGCHHSPTEMLTWSGIKVLFR